ncbi:hypothetical protein ElyMa_002916900 [Elysia marginata]|uniref:Uncharacterized protein n=1 Tax=Elysia marginata TaxID=1093978 RepID=A0AAV4I437_9GAST|nr:hypothetical protein ElyMa_002916900 [Elysia marginata]
MGSRPTYSSQRPFEAKRATSDVIFDQVVLRDNIAQDSNTQADSKQKKGQSRKKKKEEKKKSEEQDGQDTLTMFELDHVPKVHKRRKRQLMTQAPPKEKSTSKKKQKALPNKALKERADEIPTSQETADSSIALYIETNHTVKQDVQAKGAKRFKKHAKKKGKPDREEVPKVPKKSSKGYNLRQQAMGKSTSGKCGSRKAHELCAVEKNLPSVSDLDDSSMEIARDDSVIPMSFLRKGSPLFPLALSNVYGDSAADLFLDEEEIDKMAWVSISSGPKDQVSVKDSSQYTFISTYTYGSTTSKSGSKRTSQSPTVFLHKKPPHLNSSVQKGKRDIKDMKFPDFISPIFSKKAQPLTAKKADPKFSLSSTSKKKLRKCSTQLLESGSCQAPLDSPGLTTIASGTNQHGGGGDHRKSSSSDSGADEVTRKQHPDGKVRASTPKEPAVLVSLSLSPVRAASWGDEELGFPVMESIEVNTSEIIVPSLMQITDLPRRDQSALENCEEHCDLVQVPETETDVCSNPTAEPRHSPSSKQPNSKKTTTSDVGELERRDLSCNRPDCHQSKQGNKNFFEFRISEDVPENKDDLAVKKDNGQRNKKSFNHFKQPAHTSPGHAKESRLTASRPNLSKRLSKLNQDSTKQIPSAPLLVEETSKQAAFQTMKSPEACVVDMSKSSKEFKSNELLKNQSTCQELKQVTQVEDQQGAETSEIEADNEDFINLRPQNHENAPIEESGCSTAGSSLTKHLPAFDAAQVRKLNKSAYAENSHLRLCFVNRLCRQHREAQKLAIISKDFPFSISPSLRLE